MKKKLISLSCLLFATGLFVSLAAGAATRSNAVEVKASADDNSYYYIGGDFAYSTSNSEYKSLGSWKHAEYNDTQKALAGVRNHHSKIYTLTGGYYKKTDGTWVSYEDNFKFYDTSVLNDELKFDNIAGSAAKYFKTNSDRNIIVDKTVFYSGKEDGAKLTYSIRPDVTANSRTLTIENVYYYAGTRSGSDWNPAASGAITLVENAPKQLISFGAGEEFKFTNWNRNPGRKSAWYNTLDYTKLDGNAKSSFESVGDNNIKCYNKGDYYVSVSDSKLIIEYADYCYRGTATSWAQDGNHTIRVGGNPVSFTFAKDERFKFTPKLAGSDSHGDVWKNNALDWNSLLGSVETIDGVNYRSFRCFKMGTGDQNLDIICRRAGTYLVSINSTLKVTIVASNQSQTNTYYVLDLNGDLFTGESKSPHAHLFINDSLNPQISTAWPGYDMTRVSETNNIFKVDAWVDLNTIVFNNGSTGTTDLSLTGNANKVLILSWAYNQTTKKWTSNMWLSLDAAKFIDSYMKFETDHEDNAGSGKCKKESWYTNAKNAFNALSEDLRTEILSYELVNLRLSAWAAANGDTINNSGLITNNTFLSGFGSDLIVNNYTLVIVVGAVVLVGVVFIIFLRRKRKY